MATKTNKYKALPVSEKLEITKKVTAQPHLMHTKVVGQLSISVSMLNCIMANKRNILKKMCNYSARQKKLQT
jgi:hypothetical protein